MRQYKYKNRENYIAAQVERSQKKFGYCKVYFPDVIRYRELISYDLQRRNESSKRLNAPQILCLGVRSGAENDIFRSVFFGPLMRNRMLQRYAIRQDTDNWGPRKIKLSRRVGWGSGRRGMEGVRGVEINPDAERKDIFVGSYDDMPAEWENRFDIVFSNSFDHAMDPDTTLKEWRRVSAPGAYWILAFTPEKQPTEADPLGGLSFDRLNQLVGGQMVFASTTLNVTGYYEACYRIDKS